VAIPAALVLTPAADVRATGFCNGKTRPPGGQTLEYAGGPVLTQPTIVGVLWGSFWPLEPPSLSTNVAAFLDDLPEAPGFIHVLTQYGMIPFLFSLGTTSVSGSAYTGVLTDQQLQAHLAQLINFGSIPLAPSGNTLIVIFLDESTSVTFGIFNVCTATHPNQVGYHNFLDPSLVSADVSYAVIGSLSDACIASMEFPVPGVLQGRAQGDRRTIIATHEIAEAITDPRVGVVGQQAWFFGLNDVNAANEEIGDVCEDPSNAVQITVGGIDTWWVQQVYDLHSDIATNGGTPCSISEPDVLPPPSCFGPAPTGGCVFSNH
jgi:hypothetical protein